MTRDSLTKISAEHRSKTALVYVRQSSSDQVRSHPESTRIQVGLREKAIALGWSHPVMIDDDLGVSAAGFADRPGFQQMLARVAVREVGIILCAETSRLSRNSKDWAQLLELCSVFRTLIADLDQVYDLSCPNDRLVLGIKGTVSEMELDILRCRLRGGIEAKASRGELRIPLPTGYINDHSDRIIFDPDQRVQSSIFALFEQFNRHSSVRQLAISYTDTRTLFPSRPTRKGARVTWKIPTESQLRSILTHPIYAGAYVYGRRVVRVEYDDGKLVKRVGTTLEPEECRVFIPNHHPAYVAWETYLKNRSKIGENRARWEMHQNRGAIRKGSALLPGALRCGQCGRKMRVHYKRDSAQYFCDGSGPSASKRCQSFGAKSVDKAIGEELCRALQPLSLKAAAATVEQAHKQRTRSIDAARLRVKAAQYEADRAFDQFDLADPKNRLVVDTLESRLNQGLAELHKAKTELERVVESTPALSPDDEKRIHALADDFPHAWNHRSSDSVLKKRLLRAAIQEVLIRSVDERNELEITIHWQGGCHTQIQVRRRNRPHGNKTSPALVDNVRVLAQSLTDAEVARVLNMKKIETPSGLSWSKERVKNFRHQHKIRRPTLLAGDEELLSQKSAAAHLGISRKGLLRLAEIGAISLNQVTEFAPSRISRRELDSERVQVLVRTIQETGRLPREGCPDQQPSLFDHEKGT